MKLKILIAALCALAVILLGVIIVANVVPNNSIPNEHTEASTIPTDATQDPTAEPTTEPSASVEDTQEPTEVPTEPATEPSAPVEDTQEPATEPSVPVEDTQEPATESSVPVEDTQEPATEPSAPVEDTQEPTEVPTTPPTEPTYETTPASEPTQGDSDKETTPTKTEENEEASLPLYLDNGVSIVDLGNYSGMYVEDGSDVQVDSVAGVVLENTSGHTIQLVQFTLTFGQDTYEFRVTTLPHGARVLVQELNKKSFSNIKEMFTAAINAVAYFDQEPSMHSDVFDVSGTETGIELRNRTNNDIAGPIYVYYKTRNSDGYAGGITYRVTIPELKAGATYNVDANHFWIGSSEIMFIDYAQ